MKRQVKTLYRCTYAVLGADRPTQRYFEALREAKNFWKMHDFCDYPTACNFTPEHAAELMARENMVDYKEVEGKYPHLDSC